MADEAADTGNDIVVSGSRDWGYDLNVRSRNWNVPVEESTERVDDPSERFRLPQNMENCVEGTLASGTESLELNGGRQTDVMTVTARGGEDATITLNGNGGRDIFVPRVSEAEDAQSNARPHFVINGGAGADQTNGVTATVDQNRVNIAADPDRTTIRPGEQPDTYVIDAPDARYTIDGETRVTSQKMREERGDGMPRVGPDGRADIGSANDRYGFDPEQLDYSNGPVTLRQAAQPQVETDAARNQSLAFERCMNQYRAEGGASMDQVTACRDSSGAALQLNAGENVVPSSPQNATPTTDAPGPTR